MIVWYVLLFVFVLFLSTEYYTFKTGVPTIASFPSARKKIIEILEQRQPKSAPKIPYTIIDLGSGNGQLAYKIARALPASEIIGIEISFVPWLTSWLRQKTFGPANLKFQRVDFWSYDCSNADAIVTYLTENIIERVGLKLRHELKKGAIIIANDTALRGDWQPTEVVDTQFLKMKVYLYQQN